MIGDAAPASIQLAQARGEELALAWWERALITPEIKSKIMSVFENLTGNALESAQLENLYDQIIRNIGRADAEKFIAINPKQEVVVLNPGQFEILSKELNKLTGDVAVTVKNAFQQAIENGRVRCEVCKGS